MTFVLTRVSSSTFVPFFFAAPVTGDAEGALAFVSTDLGPVLLLGGKGDAGSTAERAVQVAAALNALVDQASSRPPAFEYRKDGTPAVGVVGATAPLLTATAEDAAAYDRPWEGAKARSGKAAPGSWPSTGRPSSRTTSAFSSSASVRSRRSSSPPRGKVLTDVFAEALRTAGAGNGVPTRNAIPPSSSLSKGIREVALLLPPRARPGRAPPSRVLCIFGGLAASAVAPTRKNANALLMITFNIAMPPGRGGLFAETAKRPSGSMA